jgi:hypothetical protein
MSSVSATAFSQYNSMGQVMQSSPDDKWPDDKAEFLDYYP